MKQPLRETSRGFTVLELTIVVGIIAVLVTIFIPVVGRIRQSAYAARTQQQIAAISAGIERYYNEFQAYPGPFSNQDLFGGSGVVLPVARSAGGGNIVKPLTSAENLVLGLCGGLAMENGRVTFFPGNVGQGAQGFGVAPRRYPMYFDQVSMLSSGHFKDGVGEANDSTVPEFVDQYPEALPILYLRANRGASGIASQSGGPVAQYDLAAMLPYTDSGIGSKEKISYVNTPPGRHGLRTANPNASATKNTAGYQYPYDAYPYLRNPAMPTTARQKDGFILISAGRDRIFGTDDDICNFGSVGQ